jgi:SAM-dependent methyltransferase
MSGLFAAPRLVESADDCYFYHSMEIPGHGTVVGDWDLRGREEEYLGATRFDGRRVLEVGPASGFLTMHMERCGARVVAVELPDGGAWDMVPHAALGAAPVREWQTTMRRMINGFWFAHRRHRSAAQVHQGNIYDLPPELGRFDIAVMGSVLLHVRDPLGVVAQCARISDRIVIADVHVPELDGQPVQQLFATRELPQWHTWWRFSPDLFVQFLQVMGFGRSAVTFHVQTHVNDGVEYPVAMMTIVADRDEMAS